MVQLSFSNILTVSLDGFGFPMRLLGTVAKSFATVIAKDSPLEGHLLSLFDTLYSGDKSHQLDVLTGRVEKVFSI